MGPEVNADKLSSLRVKSRHQTAGQNQIMQLKNLSEMLQI
jgi:hypothetical protein